MVIIWNDETNAVKLTVYRERILPAVDLESLSHHGRDAIRASFPACQKHFERVAELWVHGGIEQRI